MSTNQSREPPGTPAGGQWAPSRHNEADIDLGAPAPTMPGAFDAALSGGAGGPGQYAELQTATLHTGRRPIPNDIQRLAYSAFQVADKQITAEDVEDGMAEAVDRGSETYSQAYEKLSMGQRSVLRGLVGGTVTKPFSAAFARSAGLATGASVRRAIDALVADEVITKRDDLWVVTDPFLAHWLAGEVRPYAT